MQKISFLVLLFFGVISNLAAQVINPVHWKFSTKNHSDKDIELIFEAKIDDSWHVYTQYFPEGGPLPMTFTFEESKEFERKGKVMEYPAPKKEFDEIFKIEVQSLDGNARFSQRIIPKTSQTFVIKGVIDYQVCDINRCINFSEDFEFKITPSSSTNIKIEEKTQNTANSGLPILPIEVKTINPQTTETIQSLDNQSITSEITKIETIVKKVEKETTLKTKTTMIDLEGKSLWLLFWISFLAGLLAILTPCVFPMIPMTVSFFMNTKDERKKSRLQALTYGLSIILIYTIIGTVVAITLGANFANWLSTHWLPNVLFFIIFVIFAASFFGAFEIVLPTWMINKADKQADRGGYTGAFFMAFTLVLVSFSCTGPIVGAILVESAGGKVLEPIIGMFGFSLAFALPFTFFAFFPALLASWPKSGGWLNSVKVILGFIELALGLKFLSVADQTYHWGILDREIYLAIWIVIFTLMGFYLLGKIKFKHDSEVKYVSIPRLALSIITFSFVVYLIPGMFGAHLKALSGYMPPLSSHDFNLSQIIRDCSGNQSNKEISKICEKPEYSDFLHLPHGLQGYFDYEQGMKCAQKLNKPVFIDFTGHGCVNCREMEANVWSDPKVLKRLNEDYVIIALYVDDKSDLPENEWITSEYDGKVKKTIGKKYADFQISKFKVNAQPYYVLLDNKGELLTQPRAYNLNIDEFVEFLDQGVKEFKMRQ